MWWLARFLARWYLQCTDLFLAPQITHGLELYAGDVPLSIFSKLAHVVPGAVQLVRQLYAKLLNARLEVSSKTTTFCFKNSVLRSVIKTLGAERIPIRLARSVKDFGVDAISAASRPATTMKGRAAKVKRQFHKLRTLRSCARAAGRCHTSKFWWFNLRPALGFGSPAYGLSDAGLGVPCISAAQTLQTKHGQFTHCALLLGQGQFRHPEFFFLRTAICFWLSHWASSSSTMVSRLVLACRNIFAVIQSCPPRCLLKPVGGPMATLTAPLLRLDWPADRRDRWSSFDAEGGLVHCFSGTGASTVLLEAVAKSIQQRQLRSIAAHWSGSGAGMALGFTDVREFWRSHLDRQKYDDAGRLFFVATGACWQMMWRYVYIYVYVHICKEWVVVTEAGAHDILLVHSDPTYVVLANVLTTLT